MAKKKASPKAHPPPASERPGVTAERFTRFYKLVSYLAEGPRKRAQLTSHTGSDVRGFYRDLEVLKTFDIKWKVEQGLYSLLQPGEEALAKLPFPDPHLTLGEARQLARGKSPAHARLRGQLEGLAP